MDFSFDKIVKNWNFERNIPEGMEICIKEGNKVNKDTTLAKGNISKLNYTFNINYLKKINNKPVVLNGQLVRKGDIILRDNTMSPIEGIIDLSEVNLNKLNIKSIPEYSEFKSLINGQVIIAEKDKIIITTDVVRFFVPFITGLKAQGTVKILSDDLELNDNNSEETFIVTDYISTRLVSKSKVMKISGLIGKSVDIDTFNFAKKVSLPIGSILGFGKFDKVMDFKEWEGCFCELNKDSLSFCISITE